MTAPSREFETWAELIAARRCDAKAWLILPSAPHRHGDHVAVTYAELHDRAFAAARALTKYAAKGDRIVVVMDNSSDSAVAVLAVFAAAMVAVPVPPPALGESLPAWLLRTAGICRDSQAILIVGPAKVLGPCTPSMPVASLAFEDMSAGGGADGPSHPCDPRDLALLQYTSGTTERARGVRLTHSQILANVRSTGLSIGARRDEVALCWLPLFHDMGLIGLLLGATYWGMSLVLMKPHAFLMRPESWLWAIARFHVNICAAPNSAYWTCATKVQQEKLRGLDLSSWRLAFNGAELIHAETISAFTERFAAFGFRPEVMYPAYGLAECVTAVTLSRPEALPTVDWIDRDELEQHAVAVPVASDAQRARSVVSVGSPLADHEVRVVPTGARAGERIVGKIQVRGPCVTDGYFGHTSTSSNLCDEQGWLSTGDRGYIADGQLYVVGREKAVIKRAGRSLDSAYVENVMRAIPRLRSGLIAAFGAPREGLGTEEFVIVAETNLTTESDHRTLITEIVRSVHDALSFGPDVVVVAGPGAIPRTTSGKVQHNALREAYLAGKLGGTSSARAGVTDAEAREHSA